MKEGHANKRVLGEGRAGRGAGGGEDLGQGAEREEEAEGHNANGRIQDRAAREAAEHEHGGRREELAMAALVVGQNICSGIRMAGWGIDQLTICNRSRSDADLPLTLSLT